MKPPASVAVPESLFVTTTSTAPAEPAGVIKVIVFESGLAILVAATPPNVTVTPGPKPVPVIVSASPPAVEPLVVVSEVMVGAALMPKLKVAVAEIELTSVTVSTKFRAVSESVGVPLSTPVPRFSVNP